MQDCYSYKRAYLPRRVKSYTILVYKDLYNYIYEQFFLISPNLTLCKKRRQYKNYSFYYFLYFLIIIYFFIFFFYQTCNFTKEEYINIYGHILYIIIYVYIYIYTYILIWKIFYWV